MRISFHLSLFLALQETLHLSLFFPEKGIDSIQSTKSLDWSNPQCRVPTISITPCVKGKDVTHISEWVGRPIGSTSRWSFWPLLKETGAWFSCLLSIEKPFAFLCVQKKYTLSFSSYHSFHKANSEITPTWAPKLLKIIKKKKIFT